MTHKNIETLARIMAKGNEHDYKFKESLFGVQQLLPPGMAQIEVTTDASLVSTYLPTTTTTPPTPTASASTTKKRKIKQVNHDDDDDDNNKYDDDTESLDVEELRAARKASLTEKRE